MFKMQMPCSLDSCAENIAYRANTCTRLPARTHCNISCAGECSLNMTETLVDLKKQYSQIEHKTTLPLIFEHFLCVYYYK